MKKILSLLLLLSLFTTATLTSCAHKHVMSADWSTDNTYHWHACEHEGCTKSADKAEHTWNEGEITVPATIDGVGARDFTCIVCGYVKTELFNVRTTVTNEEWAAALALSNFTVTATMIERHRQDTLLMKVTDSAMYIKTDDYSFFSVKKADGWHAVEEAGLSSVIQGASASVSYALTGFLAPEGTSCVYDEATKAYIFETDAKTETVGDTTTTTHSDKYLLYFADGKLAKVEFCEGGYSSVTTLPDGGQEFDDDTRAGEVTHCFVFSDYGTTTVEVPKN